MYDYDVQGHPRLLIFVGASISGEDCLRLGGGSNLVVLTLLFSFVSPPSHLLPLEVGPLKFSQGAKGSAISSPTGVWDGAPAKSNFVHFYPKNLTSSGNDSNDFPDNQLVKFRTV